MSSRDAGFATATQQFSRDPFFLVPDGTWTQKTSYISQGSELKPAFLGGYMMRYVDICCFLNFLRHSSLDFMFTLREKHLIPAGVNIGK